jgi:lipoprotein signal peptidase
MKRFVLLFALVTNLVFADAFVKELAVRILKDRAALSVIPGFFNLAYVENRGCAWGLFQGAVWPLAAFGLAALAFLIWKRRDVFGDAWFTPGLLYAGIIGNLIDRVTREITEIFAGIGYRVVDGREVESDYYNFTPASVIAPAAAKASVMMVGGELKAMNVASESIKVEMASKSLSIEKFEGAFERQFTMTSKSVVFFN